VALFVVRSIVTVTLPQATVYTHNYYRVANETWTTLPNNKYIALHCIKSCW